MSYWPKNTGAYPKPFLFIHIPKTAGLSIQKWYKGTYGKFHKCMHGDINHPVLSQKNNEMESFCVVRNPYDLVCSWYRYKRQMLGEKRHYDLEELRAWQKGFDYWLERYIDKQNLTRDKTTPNGYNYISPSKCQLDYISTNGEVKVNYILKFENLSNDINQINEKTGFQIDIPHTNKTTIQFRDYRSAYSKKSRKLVEKYYARDLEYFGYEF